MQIGSRTAAMFISFMLVAGTTVLVKAALGTHPMHHFLFLCLLVLSVVTSRMKVKLPGLTGNMSVNLPFLFLAIVQLTLLQAAIIALAATLVQSLPKDHQPLRLIQVLFNVSTVTTAAGLAHLVFRNPLWQRSSNSSLALVFAAGTYFFFNTLPVATIISLTEGAKLLRTWSSIVHLSLPYYVAGTGITSLVTAQGTYINWYMNWALPLALLPVMLGMYRSYRIYFETALAAAPTHGSDSAALTKQKAAGAM